MLEDVRLLSASGSPPQKEGRSVRVELPVMGAMPWVSADVAIKKMNINKPDITEVGKRKVKLLAQAYKNSDNLCPKFKLSGVYGANDMVIRRNLWSSLGEAVLLVDGDPWLIGGDFNAIRGVSETMGGGLPNQVAIDDFNDFIRSIKKMKVKEKICQDLLVAERCFYRDKARATWLDEGDANTAFFHSTLKANNALQAVVTTEEIGNSMLSMKKGKNPGPDGFSVEFFKHSWSIVKCDVVEAVKTFFVTCQMPKALNTRLKVILDKIIGKQQTSFVPGKKNSEGILLMQELVAGYHKKSGTPDVPLSLGIINICFADDMFIVCGATIKTMQIVNASLKEFGVMSGLKPNLDKSTVYVAGIGDSEALGISMGNLPVRYLGIPLMTK
ncbi:hypothetical protein LIER_10919 [Lithospermum erythrorhizon]|uniref:Reverse transcriptase n=1 Tax=Lithospermum erythrorhizon TaxID=34254 RepID=A0AAV3PQ53_LITER